MTGAFLGWLAFGITAVGVVLWVRAVRRVAIPVNRGLFVAAAIAALALGGVALFSQPGWLAGSAAALSVLFGFFFLLTFAIGAQKVSESGIRVGARIPDFTALDEHGQRFDSRSLAGRPALIKFFRGHW